ncbi:S-protein homolog 5-like [Papaver somniferum]|uniref:S-protein homolog 5-like n=1 Tax=Papaver somniferum TaxID=3469 RepID=UPI000E7004BA|nr:S-protein homolog 5-like [Papaver somniferum]
MGSVSKIRSSNNVEIVLVYMFVFFLLVQNCSSAVLRYIHVHVVNDLGENIDLKMHCKEKNGFLGDRLLHYKEDYKWQFIGDVFRRKLYWCWMQWYDSSAGHWVQGDFEFYNAESYWPICRLNCEWSVRKDGVYRYSHQLRPWDWERIYSW